MFPRPEVDGLRPCPPFSLFCFAVKLHPSQRPLLVCLCRHGNWVGIPIKQDNRSKNKPIKDTKVCVCVCVEQAGRNKGQPLVIAALTDLHHQAQSMF